MVMKATGMDGIKKGIPFQRDAGLEYNVLLKVHL